tara:strand:- start:2423 stop:2668 length:246 start_codon:yes stop_codon:yes gene_type:complete
MIENSLESYLVATQKFIKRCDHEKMYCSDLAKDRHEGHPNKGKAGHKLHVALSLIEICSLLREAKRHQVCQRINNAFGDWH